MSRSDSSRAECRYGAPHITAPTISNVSLNVVPRQTVAHCAVEALMAVLHAASPRPAQMAADACVWQALVDAPAGQVEQAVLVQTSSFETGTAHSGRPITSAAHAATFGDTATSERGMIAPTGTLLKSSPSMPPSKQRAHSGFAAMYASHPAVVLVALRHAPTASLMTAVVQRDGLRLGASPSSKKASSSL